MTPTQTLTRPRPARGTNPYLQRRARARRQGRLTGIEPGTKARRILHLLQPMRACAPNAKPHGVMVNVQTLGMQEQVFRNYVSKLYGGIQRQIKSGVKYSVHRRGNGQMEVRKHAINLARIPRLISGADPRLTFSLRGKR